MASELNLCIIGCGSIGQRHLKVFCQIDGVTCSACEPRKEIAETLRKTFPLKKVFHSTDEIDFSQFDATVISTPAHLHVPIARRCVEAGCHVLSEKPLSVSLEGITELLEASQRRNVTVGVAYVYRFFPFLVQCKELIEAGAIGKLFLLDTSLGEYYPAVRPDFRTTYFGRKEMGGGVILDVLSHVANYYEWLVGAPREVSCMYASLGDLGLETEDTVVFNASYDHNILGNVVISSVQSGKYWSTRFLGSERTLQLNMTYLKTGLETVVKPEVKLIDKQQHEEVISFEPMDRDLPYKMQAQNFLNAIAGEERIRTTLEEGIETLRTVLRARDASDMRRVLEMGAPRG